MITTRKIELSFLFSLLIATTVVFTSHAASARNPRLGPEFTVSSPELNNAKLIHPAEEDDASTNESRKAQEDLVALVRQTCGDCVVTEEIDKWELRSYRVAYSDGFWFTITLDPGVLEFQSEMTPDEAERNERRLQRDLFDNSARLGLAPRDYAGGGHIHIDLITGFDADPLLFRNFFVDIANHPELAQGIFDNDSSNAPPLAELPKEQQKAFRQVLREFDSKIQSEILANPDLWYAQKIEDRWNRGAEMIRQFAEAMNTRVYTTNIRGWTPTEKYQAENLVRLASAQIPVNRRTFEYRPLRAQKNANQFTRLTRLLTARIDFIAREKGFIPYKKSALVTDKTKVRRYRLFIDETGLRFNDYRDFIPELMQAHLPAAPINDFPMCRALFN